MTLVIDSGERERCPDVAPSREAAPWRGAPDLPGAGCPEIAPWLGHDMAALEAMVRACSRESLYHRFHGAVGPAQRAARLLAGGDQEAYLAWCGGVCVGVASLGAGRDGSAHLGVLVADPWQRRGIGTALIARIADRARQLGLAAITADVMFEDRFILGLLGRFGPLSTAPGSPGYTARVELASPGRVSPWRVSPWRAAG
ncbi:MAG TPA: GNAT family N-acetyltransferase [Acidimicrobiales bacterium]|nr:GNAT family N-acetyltransferase [Acidimicrobiales bacterium]